MAVVEEPALRPLAKWRTVYELAGDAIRAGCEIAEVVAADTFLAHLEYDDVYQGRDKIVKKGETWVMR